MEKLLELLDNHELAHQLMNNDEFVEKVKDSFKENNIQIDNKDLACLANEIEKNLYKKRDLLDEDLGKDKNLMQDDQLDDVVGGFGKPWSKKEKALGTLVIAASTAAVAGLAGGFIGATSGPSKKEKAVKRRAKIGAGVGVASGAVIGGVVGNIIVSVLDGLGGLG